MTRAPSWHGPAAFLLAGAIAGVAVRLLSTPVATLADVVTIVRDGVLAGSALGLVLAVWTATRAGGGSQGRQRVAAAVNAGLLDAKVLPARASGPPPAARVQGRPARTTDATTWTVHLPEGLVASKAAAAREHLAARLRVPMSRLTIQPKGGTDPRVVTLTITDPTPRLSTRTPNLTRRTTASDPITLGRDKRTGRDVTVATVGNGADLIGGKNGSGKTVLLRLIFAHFAADPTAVIWGGDGKGNPKDWGISRHRCERWVDLNDDNAPDEYLRMLTDLHAEVNRRYKVGGTHPWMLVMLEEATNLRDMLTKPEHIARADKELRQVVMKCRAANVLVVLAAQHPSAELMPTAIREQAGVRVCMHMATPRAAEFVLGYQPAKGDLPTAEQKGHALMLVDGAPTDVLVDYIDDKAWAAFCAALPPWKVTDEPPAATPVPPLLVAASTALTAAGRPLSTTDLWAALPEGLRTATPKTLGVALSKAGATARRTRAGSVYDLGSLPHPMPHPDAHATPSGPPQGA